MNLGKNKNPLATMVQKKLQSLPWVLEFQVKTRLLTYLSLNL